MKISASLKDIKGLSQRPMQVLGLYAIFSRFSHLTVKS